MMASGSINPDGPVNPDVSELFQKMGEKLGWFKHGDLDSALKSLSKSSKKKKTTKSRIREKENTYTGTPGDSVESRNKLMLKKAKTAKENIIPRPPVSSTLKKADISGFLSSDSDTSFTTVAETFNKSGLMDKVESRNRIFNKNRSRNILTEKRNEPQIKVIQVCSDSDEEKMPQEDTYISCIGESQLCVSDLDNSTGDQPAQGSNVYDDSIMRKKVSVTSLSMDVDSIGEPLVESTRIHRRSSVTYKQLMLSSPESDDSICNLPALKGSDDNKTSVSYKKTLKQNNHNVEANDQIGNIGNDLCDAVENLTLEKGNKHIKRFLSDSDIIDESPEQSPEQDARYTTAFESLDDVDSTCTNYTSRGSSNDTNEFVEVTDVATQTEAHDDIETSDKHYITMQNPVTVMYGDETVISPKSPTVYGEETFIRVDDNNCKHNGGFDIDMIVQTKENLKADDVYMSTTNTIDPHTSIYEQSTVNNLTSVSLQENNVTEDGTMGHVYSQITVDMTTTKETNNKDLVEINNIPKQNISGDSDTSMYEVVDVCTQTERVSVSSVDIGTDEADDSPNHKQKQDTDGTTELINCDCDLNDVENDDYTSDNELFEDNVKVSRVDDINNSINSDPAVSLINSSLERKFKHSTSKLGDSSTSSTANLKGKPTGKQKASHCFDLSSDSDSSVDPADLAKDSETKSSIVTDNSLDQQSIDDADGENIMESRHESGSTDGSDSQDKNRITDRSEEDFASFANTKSDRNVIKVPEVDVSQTWRKSQVHDSESSEDDNLEAFLQKLKQPEKKKCSITPDSSPRSMEDFIVEDDEMTSESDDEEFYLRENQQLEKTPSIGRFKSSGHQSASLSDDTSDEMFSSKIYPSSVTKHKQKKKQLGTHRDGKSSSMFCDSSSDSENDLPVKHGGKSRPESKQTNKKRNMTSPSSDSDKEIDIHVKNKERNGPKPKQSAIKKSITKQSSNSDSEEELQGKPGGNSRTEQLTQKSIKKKMSNWSSDSESPLFKTPNPIRKIKQATLEVNEQVNESNSVFRTPVARAKSSFTDYISLSDDDSSGNDDSLPSLSSTNKENIPIVQTPVKSKSSDFSGVFSKVPTPLSKIKTPRVGDSVCGREGNFCSFLGSLSTTTEDHRRDPDAIKYVKNFKKTREDLTKHLFDLYNMTVFDKKLPADLPVIWNKRLRKSAGYCAYNCNRTNKEDRTTRIELSTKVCDSAERVRDTLIHELCHAAVWLVNGVNGGHGNFWKYWARQASKVHPELPTISRCHSYAIATKFTYRCTRCGYSIGRHSKSLDTSRKICGRCRGTFELIRNAIPATPQSASASSVGSTPRTPNRFALFVKENFNIVKQKNKDLKHGDLMKELSKQFAASKLNS